MEDNKVLLNEVNTMRRSMGLEPLTEWKWLDNIKNKLNRNKKQQQPLRPITPTAPSPITPSSPTNIPAAATAPTNSGGGITIGPTRPFTSNAPTNQPVATPPVKPTQQKPASSASKELQLFGDIKRYFQELLNYKTQIFSGEYGQVKPMNAQQQYGGSGTITTKLTKPGDINDIVKLMEGLDITEAPIDDMGLSQNQLKLFKSNYSKLERLAQTITMLKTGDPNLDGLLSKAKANLVSQVDMPSLLQSDPKSLKIFVNSFNKAIYSTQFKNGNNIIDQLKNIDINKINEASVRVPGRGDANQVINARRDFIKNIPSYMTILYSIFSFLLDKKKKGQLTPKPTAVPAQKPQQPQPSPTPASAPDEETEEPGDETDDSNTGDSKEPEKIGRYYNMNHKGDQEDDDEEINENILQALINNHDKLIGIISEEKNLGGIVKTYEYCYNTKINRIKLVDFLLNEKMDVLQYTSMINELSNKDMNRVNKIKNNLDSAETEEPGSTINPQTIEKNLDNAETGEPGSTYSPQMIQKNLDNTEKEEPGSTINPNTIQQNLDNAETDAPGSTYNPQMIQNNLDNAESGEPGSTQSQQTTNNTKEPINMPELFMPEKVGNYNLNGIKQAARIALSQKAAEVINRNNDIAQSPENMVEVMKQLCDDINQNGQKQVPTV